MLLGMLAVVVCVALLVNAVLVGVGLAAKEASDRFLALPTDLRPSALPQRSVMLDATGRPIAWFWEESRAMMALARARSGSKLCFV